MPEPTYDYLHTYPPGSARAHKRRSAARVKAAKLVLPSPSEFVPVSIRFPDRTRRHCLRYDDALKAIRDYLARADSFDAGTVDIAPVRVNEVLVTERMVVAGMRVFNPTAPVPRQLDAIFRAMLEAM